MAVLFTARISNTAMSVAKGRKTQVAQRDGDHRPLPAHHHSKRTGQKGLVQTNGNQWNAY